ncbi:uncharacterized protein LOC117930459 [Vitis riparia]|uniref:uncharacterized protein LOC117930459 n=1 Tax=Vitis riparia TaxID=96939 RepID=UPI00155A381E|nr:uncharacterized protein LOC117930459 [Vitis riparia]
MSPLPGTISRRLDDMLSTPFSYRIINYEPPRGFLMPKFSAYDGSNDLFDHIMHYRQLMTLDIGNYALFCKENESLREFVKQFGQAVLQVESYNMDVLLQIFKRSICPSTPFFESLAKKPLTTMDDLFRRANKYSMLEDDIHAATQQILVTRQPFRSDVARSSKPLSQQRPLNRRQGEQRQLDSPPLTPLIVSYEKFLPMIRELFDFRWLKPLKADPAKRDHNRKCAYHKEHEHSTEQCRSLHYLVEKLIRAKHLKQYIRSGARRGETSRSQASGAPSSPIVPRVVINYIHGGLLDEEYDSK